MKKCSEISAQVAKITRARNKAYKVALFRETSVENVQFYNGIEFALSVLMQRDPVYIDVSKI